MLVLARVCVRVCVYMESMCMMSGWPAVAPSLWYRVQSAEHEDGSKSGATLEATVPRKVVTGESTSIVQGVVLMHDCGVRFRGSRRD